MKIEHQRVAVLTFEDQEIDDLHNELHAFRTVSPIGYPMLTALCTLLGENGYADTFD